MSPRRSPAAMLLLVAVALAAAVPLYLLSAYGGLSRAWNIAGGVLVFIPGFLAIWWAANRR